MNALYLVCIAGAAVALTHATDSAAEDSADRGRTIFEQRCQTCHGGTGPADSPIGPSLAGVLGRKVGSGDSGIHSRAAVESDTVWTRSSLRRFLAEPGREMPGTFMPVQVTDPKELDELLNYLQTLR